MGRFRLQDIMVTAGEGVYCRRGYQGKSGDVRVVRGCKGLSKDVRVRQGMSRDVKGYRGI